MAPCLTKEDMEENFPCSSTRNINWFLNTMNDCFAESNVIMNQDNFMDVFGNAHYYNGKNWWHYEFLKTQYIISFYRNIFW